MRSPSPPSTSLLFVTVVFVMAHAVIIAQAIMLLPPISITATPSSGYAVLWLLNFHVQHAAAVCRKMIILCTAAIESFSACRTSIHKSQTRALAKRKHTSGSFGGDNTANAFRVHVEIIILRVHCLHSVEWRRRYSLAER